MQIHHSLCWSRTCDHIGHIDMVQSEQNSGMTSHSWSIASPCQTLVARHTKLVHCNARRTFYHVSSDLLSKNMNAEHPFGLLVHLCGFVVASI